MTVKAKKNKKNSHFDINFNQFWVKKGPFLNFIPTFDKKNVKFFHFRTTWSCWKSIQEDVKRREKWYNNKEREMEMLKASNQLEINFSQYKELYDILISEDNIWR